MPIGINLLPSKRKELKPWRRQLKNGAVIALSVYVGLVAVLLVFGLFTSRKLAKVKTKELELENQIKKDERKEKLAYLLKDRVSKERKLTQGRIDYGEVFNLIENLSLPDIALSELDISEGGLELTGEAGSATSLKSFLEEINRLETQLTFAEISSLARNKDGKYGFSLKIILGN